MNIKITKDAFGPYRITATLQIDPKAKRENGTTNQDYYMSLGGLYELERKPASAAEKLFWGANKRPSDFKRNQDIPVSEDARQQIVETLAAAGYQDISVEVRETTEAGPAWKTKVAALVGMPELDEDITTEQVRGMITKLAAKLGVDVGDMLAYAKSKGLK